MEAAQLSGRGEGALLYVKGDTFDLSQPSHMPVLGGGTRLVGLDEKRK